MDLIGLLLVFFFGSCSAKYILPQETSLSTGKISLDLQPKHLIKKRTPADIAMTASRSRQRNKLLRQLWLSQMLDGMRTRATNMRGERTSKNKKHHSQGQGNSSDGDDDTFKVVDMKRALRGYPTDYNDNDDLEVELKNDIEAAVELVINQSDTGKQLEKIIRLLYSQSENFLPPPIGS